MSANQLNEAIQLAQGGQREKARQLLWQVVRSDPQNESAWLWLASVAADQGEYARAVNEVLRINPNNDQARQMQAQLQQQPGGMPPAGGRRAPRAPRMPRGTGGGPAVPRFLVLILGVCIAALVLGGIAFLAIRLLSGGGGEEVKFELENRNGDKTYEFAVTVPDSWEIAIADDEEWEEARDELEDELPFSPFYDGEGYESAEYYLKASDVPEPEEPDPDDPEARQPAPDPVTNIAYFDDGPVIFLETDVD
ncbi:MAG: tetratricopeptide repeat protein, partial [Chloroflexi bacterium]|nr:tetratricopeptide repeat protein [Chloroflexota bacterium]